MVYGMTATLDEGPPADVFEIQLSSGFGVYKDAVAQSGTVVVEEISLEVNGAFKGSADERRVSPRPNCGEGSRVGQSPISFAPRQASESNCLEST